MLLSYSGCKKRNVIFITKTGLPVTMFTEYSSPVSHNKSMIKKTRRLASPALGRRQGRSCTYTVFLKFPTTSNWLLVGNL